MLDFVSNPQNLQQARPVTLAFKFFPQPKIICCEASRLVTERCREEHVLLAPDPPALPAAIAGAAALVLAAMSLHPLPFTAGSGGPDGADLDKQLGRLGPAQLRARRRRERQPPLRRRRRRVLRPRELRARQHPRRPPPPRAGCPQQRCRQPGRRRRPRPPAQLERDSRSTTSRRRGRSAALAPPALEAHEVAPERVPGAPDPDLPRVHAQPPPPVARRDVVPHEEAAAVQLMVVRRVQADHPDDLDAELEARLPAAQAIHGPRARTCRATTSQQERGGALDEAHDPQAVCDCVSRVSAEHSSGQV